MGVYPITKMKTMKITRIGGALMMATMMFVACSSSTEIVDQKTDSMMNEKDSLSYALGILMGGSLEGQGFDLNHSTFGAAFEAAVEGNELKMTKEDANALVQGYQQKQAMAAAEENIQKGKDYLVENAKRPEVTTTASGLQYEVLKEGTGQQPLATDQVTVHYTGKLLDGKVFDSSVERGEPATFGLNQVIRGWTEGVQLMKEGAKYRFHIPSELAYGERGAGADIGPGATLVFDVELLSIQK